MTYSGNNKEDKLYMSGNEINRGGNIFEKFWITLNDRRLVVPEQKNNRTDVRLSSGISAFHFVNVNIVFFHFPDERIAGDPEKVCSCFLIEIAGFQCISDQFDFLGFHV